MREAKSIHTLNARDHVMLEVVRDYFKVSPEGMFREIQGLRAAAEEALAVKGVNYDKLRTALVPDRQRREVALIFDSMSIKSSWYGLQVFKRLIPLLDIRANHSLLEGDYLARRGHEDAQFAAFERSVILRRNVKFVHPSQFYIVYINNLTPAMVERIDAGLTPYGGYVGYADMTYSSMLKLYLSTMLVSSCLKHGSIIIQGHEPDRDPSENINMRGYPFEKYGYTFRSISDDIAGTMLTYKIERPVVAGFEVDTEMALNAISVLPMPLKEFAVYVEEAKLNYLKNEKNGSLQRAGLSAVSISELESLIRAKIAESYIYNLCIDRTYGISKFNVILEIPSTTTAAHPTRLLAALEYQPEKRALRLLTLY